MCRPRGTQVPMDTFDCGCGPLYRRFYSTEEEKDRLERYRKQLEKELSGVEEYIKEIKGK